MVVAVLRLVPKAACNVELDVVGVVAKADDQEKGVLEEAEEEREEEPKAEEDGIPAKKWLSSEEAKKPGELTVEYT